MHTSVTAEEGMCLAKVLEEIREVHQVKCLVLEQCALGEKRARKNVANHFSNQKSRS